MNILNKLTLKHLSMNKRRTIVTIIGILLSTALMVGIGLICSSLREYLIEDAKESQGSYHVKFQNVPSSKLEILDKDNKIDTIYYEDILGYAPFIESTNEAKVYFKVKAVNKEFFQEFTLTEGRFPQNDNEIVISNHVYQYGDFPYKIGETITLPIGNRTISDTLLEENTPYMEEETLTNQTSKTYTIVGKINRVNYNYESYSDPGFSFYTLLKNKEKNVNVYFTYKNPANVYKYTDVFMKILDLKVEDVSFNETLLSLYGQSKYDNFSHFILSFMILFLSIISVACTIVVYNSFHISVLERKKQFGLFSSIGATKRQIQKTVFFEAFVVGTIGIILGIFSAYLGIGTVIFVLNQLLSSYLDMQFSLVTYPLFIIVPIIFMIFVVFISAMIPAKKAARVSPIEAIRQNDEIYINKRHVKTPKFIYKIFGIEGTLSLKNIKRNKKKYRITVLSLFISIVTFIAFSTYLEIGKSTASDFIGEYDYDIELYIDGENYDHDAIAAFLKSEEIDKYTFAQTIRPYVKINPKLYTDSYLEISGLKEELVTQQISVILLDDVSYQNYKEELNLKEDRPIMVRNLKHINYENHSRKVEYMDIYKSNLSEVSLQFCDLSNIFQDDKEYSYPQDEITNEIVLSSCQYTLDNIYLTNKVPFGFNNFEYLFVNEEIFSQIENKTNASHLPSSKNSTIFIQAKKYEQLDKIGKNLSQNSSIFYNNITENMKSEKDLLLAISILLYGFITLVTLIGVTSVFNTITTSIMLRKKEFSILRSIGLSPKGFNKMIYFESFFFGMKSLLYGIPVGIFLSFLINENMNMLVENRFHLPVKAIVISIICVFVITLCTMKYATNKIKKENILDAIREENI